MQKPEAGPEHLWLQKFVGEWLTQGEVNCGESCMATSGTESTRALGDFWIITEIRSAVGEGAEFHGIMQLGYDEANGGFVGSFIDNMGTHMWKYAGERNAGGNAVVLSSEGPFPDDRSRMMQVRETLEMLDENTRRFTSEVQGEDGNWTVLFTSTARRKQEA